MIFIIRSQVTTRFAFLFVPILASTTVIHFPTFMPITMGAAIEKVTAPVEEIACKRPTDAEEL